METSMDNNDVVFVVDDDPAVRDSLQLLLEASGFQTRCFAAAAEFLDVVDQNARGCLIADIRMPGPSGLDMQDQLISMGIQLPVLFLTGHGNVSMSVRALKAGAVEFLEKPFDGDELLRCVADAIVLDQSRSAESRARDEARALFLKLTPREKQVMREVVAGKTNKDIGKALDISYRTVEGYRSRVMEKMKVGSLADLVQMSRYCDPGSVTEF